MSASIDIPSWATVADGERALKNVDDIISAFKLGHERALEKATRQAWLAFFDDSFTATLEAVATFRQSIAIAQLVRDRIMKLLDQLKAKPA